MSLSLSLHYVPGAEVRNCPSKERCPWSWLCGSGRGSLLTCSSSSRRLRLACLRLALVCVIPGVGLRQVFAGTFGGRRARWAVIRIVKFGEILLRPMERTGLAHDHANTQKAKKRRGYTHTSDFRSAPVLQPAQLDRPRAPSGPLEGHQGCLPGRSQHQGTVPMTLYQ